MGLYVSPIEELVSKWVPNSITVKWNQNSGPGTLLVERMTDGAEKFTSSVQVPEGAAWADYPQVG